MAVREPGITHAISDTGPLISIFQSDSLDLVTALVPVIHIPSACVDELVKHGWDKLLQSASSRIATHYLTESEKEMAWTVARAIALHPMSRDPVPNNHLGEAQAIALATRPEFANDVRNRSDGVKLGCVKCNASGKKGSNDSGQERVLGVS